MSTPQKRDTPATGGGGEGDEKSAAAEGATTTTTTSPIDSNGISASSPAGTAVSGNALLEREILNASVMMNTMHNTNHQNPSHHPHHEHQHPKLHHKEDFLQYSGKKAPRVGADFQATIPPQLLLSRRWWALTVQDKSRITPTRRPSSEAKNNR
jgi:hypothetical protein